MSAKPGAFVCINCGAALTFQPEGGGDPLEKAACKYCGVINDRLQAELLQRATDERAEQLDTASRKRLTLQIVSGVLIGATVLAGLAAFRTGQGLVAVHAEVDRARSQVVNARERQAATVARWQGQAADPDREPELSGAENRVLIERERYDQAAAAYNAQTGSSWAAVCARLRGLPAEAPLSSEVTW